MEYQEQIDKLKKLSATNAFLGYNEDAEFFTEVRRLIIQLNSKHQNELMPKPLNSEKPIICQILGVEVGEKFHIACFSRSEDVEFVILDDGTFRTNPPGYPGSAYALLQSLDHPERIIRR